MREEPVSVVLVTAPDAATAEAMGAALVDARLVACVNVVPGVTSIYRWDGAVQRDQEVLMLLKLPARAFDKVRAKVLDLHPYDTPEILALDVAAGDSRYLEWVRDSVGGDG